MHLKLATRQKNGNVNYLVQQMKDTLENNFQRAGSKSNAHVGKEFEIAASDYLATQNIETVANLSVELGHGNRLKSHNFDLGSINPPIIIECKSHKWTQGDKVPSAKLTVWNEAMYYFHLAPSKYRKILFVLRNERKSNGETLAEYYVRTNFHLIPSGVEIWEYNEVDKSVRVVHS